MGPKVMLTLADAATVLPYIASKADAQEAADKIRAALAADPKWWEPIR